MRRLLLGLSQERLGERLGLTFQQIQKYERGANRLGASRLYEAAQALSVDVGFFFDDLACATSGLEEDSVPYLVAPITAPDARGHEALELVRAFEQIDDPELRRRLVELAKALSRAHLPSPGA